MVAPTERFFDTLRREQAPPYSFFDRQRADTKKSRPFRVGSGMMYGSYLTARVLYFLILFRNRTSIAAAEARPTTTAMG